MQLTKVKIGGLLTLKKFLDSAPADTVFRTAELEEKLGLPNIHRRFSKCTPEYHVIVTHDMWWGNPKAISNLRSRIENQ